jgi:hypothetical protein
MTDQRTDFFTSQLASIYKVEGILWIGRQTMIKPRLTAQDQHVHFKSSKSLSSKASHSPVKVLASFNTWAFKREQPSDVELLLETVAHAMARQEPLQFVLYWGKGPRHDLASPDVICLDYLASLCQRIVDVYQPGAGLTLILTDTHAELNGHAAADIDAYYRAIGSEAKARKFHCRRLSEATGQVFLDAPLDDFDNPNSEMLDQLQQSAAKWYDGEKTTSEAALQYFRMNMREKRVIEHLYPASIFITFNNSAHRILFPDNLPIFYMYSIKKGVAVKPWFMASSAEAAD